MNGNNINFVSFIQLCESVEFLKTLYGLITAGMHHYGLVILVRLNNLYSKGQHLEFVFFFFLNIQEVI